MADFERVVQALRSRVTKDPQAQHFGTSVFLDDQLIQRILLDVLVIGRFARLVARHAPAHEQRVRTRCVVCICASPVCHVAFHAVVAEEAQVLDNARAAASTLLAARPPELHRHVHAQISSDDAIATIRRFL